MVPSISDLRRFFEHRGNRRTTFVVVLLFSVFYFPALYTWFTYPEYWKGYRSEAAIPYYLVIAPVLIIFIILRAARIHKD